MTNEQLKQNLLQTIKEHLLHGEGNESKVSVDGLYELVHRAGIDMTKEETLEILKAEEK
jgi:hypothetical protein